MNIDKYLTELLKKSNSLPFLFVGSGISRRYLNLPDWGGLLKEFSDDTEYYIQKYNANYPKVATALEELFFETFWNTKKYEKMKESYLKTNLKGQQYPLKYAIAEFFKNYKINEEDSLQDEIEALKKVNVDGIITTNYDIFLESIFDFTVYKGQDELLFTKTLEIAEIYKIHGCASKFETIVITENDYAKFHEQNIYLTSKLTSLFIEHPIIFLGYSLSDNNVISILKNIASSIGKNHLNKLQDRIVFIEYETDTSKHLLEKSTKTIDNLIIPITLIKTNNFLSIYKALAKTQRKIPAKCLRLVESNIYELIKTNDPKGKMAVVDIEKINDYTDIEFYAGVGVISEISNKGYNCIETIDLFEDLIFDVNNYKFPENIITKTLPMIFQKTPALKSIPIFKYLYAMGINKENYMDDTTLHRNIIEIIDQDISAYKITPTYFEDDVTFISKTFKLLDSKMYDSIDLVRFENFLTFNKDYLKDKSNPTANTYYKKLACLYDRLKYGWFNE